jgi:hypothetical protein
MNYSETVRKIRSHLAKTVVRLLHKIIPKQSDLNLKPWLNQIGDD